MKLYVPTCNQYLHLIKPYSMLMKKYWPNQKVVVLGYDRPDFLLPVNFDFISLGKQEDFGKSWTNGLIPFFQNLDEHHLMLSLDDMFLIHPVPQWKVNVMEGYVASGTVQKAIIHSHLNNIWGELWEEPNDYKMIKIRQNADYRTTIHPSIWNREYLLKYLKPNFTLWQFELSNFAESKRDGATIIAWPTTNADGEADENRGDNIFNTCNIYRAQGKVQWKNIDLLCDEDQMMIKEHLPK